MGTGASTKYRVQRDQGGDSRGDTSNTANTANTALTANNSNSRNTGSTDFTLEGAVGIFLDNAVESVANGLTLRASIEPRMPSWSSTPQLQMNADSSSTTVSTPLHRVASIQSLALAHKRTLPRLATLDPLLPRTASVPALSTRVKGQRAGAVSPGLQGISEAELESIPGTPAKLSSSLALTGPDLFVVPDEDILDEYVSHDSSAPSITENNNDITSSSSNASIPPKFRPPKLLLRTPSFEDDADWDQVSDDDNLEQSQVSPRFQRPRLSVSAAAEESYRFTASGYLHFDGAVDAIEPGGAIGSAGLSMRDRLVFMQRLGSGASGVVYKALDIVHMKLVAVKVVSIYDRAKRRQIVRELGALHDSIATTSTSSNVVGFIDAFCNAGDATVGIVVEYMDGGSLEDIATQGGCESEVALASIARQLLEGLGFLHDECNQLHRDLKPANVLINRKGEVKISDFGIAKNLSVPKPIHVNGASDLTDLNEEKKGLPEASTFVGTLTYMSPERINGGAYSYAADVWSAGLTILTTALGKLPIEAEGGYWSVMACVREEEPPSLPKEDNRWSPSFRDFINSCMVKDEAKRPTCRELLQHPFITGSQELAAEALDGPDGSLSDLVAILEAVVVHVEKMVERQAVFSRSEAGITPELTLPSMLSEIVLKKPELLNNLAGQLDLSPSELFEYAKTFVAKAAMRHYLGKDSDTD